MTASVWGWLIALAPLLVISALFSGSETALFGLRARQRLDMERRGGAGDRAALKLLEHPRQLLITILVGNMAANIAWFTIVAVLVSAQPWDVWGAVAVQAAGILIIVLAGEVMPKAAAASDTAAAARRIALPLQAVHLMLLPVRQFVERFVVNPTARLVGDGPGDANDTLTDDDLDRLLAHSADAGVVDAVEERHLAGVLALGRLGVRRVMTPRTRLTALDIDDDAAAITDAFLASGLSRLPVRAGDLDHIVGILHARDWLQSDRPDKLGPLLREPVFVPAVAPVERVLDTLQQQGRKMAVVVDEFGGTAGIVSMRDLVEPLTGTFDDDRLATDTEAAAS